jgi:hypothetical protein
MEDEDLMGMGMPPEEPMMDEPMSDDMPMDETPPMFDMETMMGNFMDMPQERRDIATRLLASPAIALIDEILGQPTLARLATQLGEPIPITPESDTAPTPMEGEGMMAPAPMEDEEAPAPLV